MKIRHPWSYRAVNWICIVRINTNPIHGLKYTSPSTTYLNGSSQLARTAENELGSCSANSAQSANLSNKWMPELESTCDLRSKTLFSTRSFTPEHRFAFDSRVPASSCVQIPLHCKVASNRVTALLQPNKHAGHSALDRKSPKDSNFAIYFLFRGPQHVRFLSVLSKLQQQISWKKSLVPRIAQNRLI